MEKRIIIDYINKRIEHTQSLIESKSLKSKFAYDAANYAVITYKDVLSFINESESLRKASNLKLSIDDESVNIYIDNGEDEEPTHVCYWYFEEWEEDMSILPSIFNAIQLFYENPAELLNKLNFIK